MSTSTRRCIQSCLRTLKRTDIHAQRVSNRTFSAVRAYGQAALQQRAESSSDARASFAQQQKGEEEHVRVRNPASKWRDEHSMEPLAKHLNDLFAPLTFPPELAQRVLTHGSHQTAKWHGHNAALSFSGRRVMEAYLMMFLNASSALKPTHDLQKLAHHALNVNVLGEYVGKKWDYGNILQWTPAVTRRELEAATDVQAAWHRIGFYKVQGDAVVATIGAVFQQYGGAVAHRLFHTQVLPSLVVPGGLPNEFGPEVDAVCKQMGGPDVNLLTGQPKSPRASS